MPYDIDPIVSVDSMTLVWGIRKEGPEEQCLRAKWLFGQFTKRRTQVIVSAVAVSEYLTAIEQASHASVIAEMEKRFLIMPFNEHCASLAASLFQMGLKMRLKNEPGGRPILRADTMVVATAKTFGAGTLYSGDDACRRLAIKAGLKALDLPEPERDLFRDIIE